jgi:hypothetical protein
LSFDAVQFWTGSGTFSAEELKQNIRDLRYPQPLYLAAALIPVLFVDHSIPGQPLPLGPGQVGQPNPGVVWPPVPLSDRIYDLKMKYAQAYRINPSFVHFFLNGQFLSDAKYLSELCFHANIRIDVTRARRPFCAMHFSQLDGKSIRPVYRTDTKLTFEWVAGKVSPDPASIEFIYRGERIPRAEEITKQLWDPAEPIEICLREMVQKVDFEQYRDRSTSLPITSNSTVESLIKELKQQYPDISCLTLFCGSCLRNSDRVLKVNPDLDRSFVARNVQFFPTLEFSFDCGSRQIKLTTKGSPFKCASAKELLSRQLGCPAQGIQISLKGIDVPNNRSLSPKNRYMVTISQHSKSLVVMLLPVPPAPDAGRLVRELSIDLSVMRTVGPLVAMICGDVGLGEPKDLVVKSADRVLSSLMELWELTDPIVVEFRRPPSAPATFHFVHNGTTVCDLVVQPDELIVQTKFRLLIKLDRHKTLVGVLDMRFWGVELSRNPTCKLSAYGIAPNSTIHVDDLDFRTLTLRDQAGAVETYFFGTDDTVGALAFVVAYERKVEAGNVELLLNKRPLEKAQVLSELPSLELHLVEYFVFQSKTGTPTRVAVPRNATLDAAKSLLAEELGLAPRAVQFTTGDPDKLLRDFTTLTYDVANVSTRSQRVITQQSASTPQPGAVPQAAAIPQSGATAMAGEGIIVQVSVNIGACPWIGEFNVPAGETFGELEEKVRQRVGYREAVDIMLTDEDGETIEVLDRAVLVRSRDVVANFVVVQKQRARKDPPKADPPAPESPSQQATNPGSDDGDEPTRLDRLRVSCGPSPMEVRRVTFTFYVADSDTEFPLQFAPGQTVLDAKKKIQEKYDLDLVDDVTLLFSGKTLRDAFVLDRLRIGTQRIVVHLSDTVQLILFTAIGRRQSSQLGS